MPLHKPVDGPVSQDWAGSYHNPTTGKGEPRGWFAPTTGRPRRAYGQAIAGWRYQRYAHKGVDIYGPRGKQLVAMEAGRVLLAGAYSSFAGAKIVRQNILGHPEVRITQVHLDTVGVKVGQVLRRGQAIGTMGNSGYADGVHDHAMIEILEVVGGVKRWIAYDLLAFLEAGSYRKGAPYGGQLLPGGSLRYDDRIYPIHSVTIADGARVRADHTTSSEILLTTQAPITVPQLNAVPGGDWDVGPISGSTWAKVRVPVGSAVEVGYVATALIKPV